MTHSLVTDPVTVPSDFLGLNLITYPISGNNPVGKIKWGQVRLTLAQQARWATIETSAGVYSASALATLDQIVTFHRQSGATVMLGLYATPVFYAQTFNNPTVADNLVRGPWFLLGECSHPTSMSAVTSFVSMMVSRYNLPGGAWFDAVYKGFGELGHFQS